MERRDVRKRSDLVKFPDRRRGGEDRHGSRPPRHTQRRSRRRVARLEKEYEGRLFERIPTGVPADPARRRGRERARRILREIEDRGNRVAALARATGSFRITAGPGVDAAVLVRAVAASMPRFPRSAEAPHRRLARTCVRLLADGSADLHVGGIDTGEARPGSSGAPLLAVTAGIVAHPDHPLHAAGSVPPILAGCPWIDLDGPAAGGDGRPWPPCSTSSGPDGKTWCAPSSAPARRACCSWRAARWLGGRRWKLLKACPARPSRPCP